MHAGATRPLAARSSQHTAPGSQQPHDPCSSAGPSVAEANDSRISSGTAAAADELCTASEHDPIRPMDPTDRDVHSPMAEQPGDACNETQTVPEGQPAADAGGWGEGFDDGFDGFDGGDDWGDVPLDSEADTLGAGA